MGLPVVGFWGGLIFYDSLLPEVSTDENRGRVGGVGVGVGYVGSLLAYAIGTVLLGGRAESGGVEDYASVFRGIAEISERHGRRVSTVAHAGDGNLHSTVEAPDTSEGIAAADRVIDDITRLAISLGGTISGEHGIGSLKRHELPWQLDEAALDVQRAIKAALDPRGILTPDRAV